MLRALALVSALALTAGGAFAQTSYPMPQEYPPAGQAPTPGPGYGGQAGYGQGAGQNGGGYGGFGYGQGADGYGGQGGYGGGGYGHGPADPQTRALRQQMRAACATDVSTYCADAGQGGHGALHQCMMANQARFSPPCQSAIAALHAHGRQMRMQGGGPDAAAPSADMPPPSQPPPQ